MSSSEIAVKVDSVSKTFHIPLEASSGLKQQLINTLKGRKGYREFTPLDDLSFEIKQGEFFGIVGRNGSGKSTLLKTIAGIYNPTSGAVHVNGTLVPFIELGVGFNPELTGKENVFLNGALLGFSHAEMEAMYDEIVDFAELHDFMEERLKNYSSGMQVRLAFSIAIRARGDILLLDEVLAVGDEAFQRKCFDYFEQLKRQGATVILVTHDMGAVQRFCSRAILINKGKIACVGDPYEIATQYMALNQELPSADHDSIKKVHPKLGELAKLIGVQRTDGSGNVFKGNKLCLDLNFSTSIDDAVVSVSIIRSDNVYVGGANTFEEPSLAIGEHNIQCAIDLERIIPGSYFVNVSIYNKDFNLLDFGSHVVRFGRGSQLKNRDGIVNLAVEWRHE